MFVMASALDIKKSLGITRGKNDKIDACRIANYAYEKRDKLTPTILPGAAIDIPIIVVGGLVMGHTASAFIKSPMSD